MAADEQCVSAPGMLLRQAVFSFSLWTDRDAPIDVMRDALRRELGDGADV